MYPKEKALVDLVAMERLEGRRVLVYVTHTGTKDITGRMDDILTRNGFRVAVMKAHAVAPDRREARVANRVKEGIDVLICHPRLVQTGLDLIDFPTIVWGEVEAFNQLMAIVTDNGERVLPFDDIVIFSLIRTAILSEVKEDADA